MKHNVKITIILLVMFFITQLIGLAVIHAYSPKQEVVFNETTQQEEIVNVTPQLPYGMQPPEDLEPGVSLTTIITAFIIAIVLIVLLSRIKAALFLKLWFFFVVVIALGLTISPLLKGLAQEYAPYIAAVIALPLAFYKVFKRNLIVHNLTELLIYPGIATVFVPILNLWTVIILLLLISAYDMYAVWHSGFMQKMAKFQIQELKFFAGFFIPYVSTKDKAKIIEARKSKSEKGLKKIKVNLAILGGGDVVFPIITSGVVFRMWGFPQALLISIFATLSLLWLFVIAKKGKFYPAMPFITIGCLVGIFFGWLI